MLLRIAVAVVDKEQEDVLHNRLLGISFVLGIEFDIALFSGAFTTLLKNMQNMDMVIMDYTFLNIHREKLSEIYKSNKKCFPVLVGKPVEKISEFLIVRPIGHIESGYSIDPENKADKVKQICNFILDVIKEEFENKKDNSVIYITTKKKSYAIPKEKILFCQGDLKYTILVTDDGNVIRKLGKLQDVEDKFLWDFKRVHQSFLINPGRVTGIDKTSNELILDGDLRIPYSRKYTETVKSLLKY